MKQVLRIFLLLFSIYAKSQTDLSGIVKDQRSNQPIPYSAVGIKNSAKGCLSNEEGAFKLSSVLATDTLVVSVIGYKKKTVAVSDFVKNPIILLQQKENLLAEVIVYSSDDYLYEAFARCRKNLLRSGQIQSKAYFVLESEFNNEPAELLECYYNASHTNSGINALNFKNGRIGLAPHDGRYFINMNTSRAISFLNLVVENKYLPIVPLQLEKRKLKKLFRLKLKSVYDTVNPVYQIEFTSRVNNGKTFDGEVWIEKNSGQLKNIILSVVKTTHHPFLPVFKDFGEIKNVSMQIQKVFTSSDTGDQPSHLYFDYQINYRHIHNDVMMNANPDTSFIVNSKGVMKFYDYNKLFYLPHFDYNNEMSDYRKITSLTYNEGFWAINEGLMYSDKMKKAIVYFKKNGQLINYKANTPHGLYKNGFFENKNITWTQKERLSLKRDSIQNDTTNASGTFLALAYKLKAQIFFDINKAADSLQHYSCSVFDVYASYYNIRQEHFTNCFLNIYFDLYEIERRNLEELLHKKNYSIAQMDSIHTACVARVTQQTDDYLKEVERGKNFKALSKWNAYVKEKLDIDNMLIFNVTAK